MISTSELEAIALIELADEVSKNVHGMDGFRAFVLKNQKPGKLKLLRRYLKIRERLRKSFMDDVAKDLLDPPATAEPMITDP